MITSLILILLGLVGLLGLVALTLPTLGPRWFFFFFITICASGFFLPFIYLINRRIAKYPISENLLLRETIFTAVFINLLAWLRLGRVLTPIIFLLLFVGFTLLEFFLRLSEGAVFQPNHNNE